MELVRARETNNVVVTEITPGCLIHVLSLDAVMSASDVNPVVGSLAAAPARWSKFRSLEELLHVIDQPTAHLSRPVDSVLFLLHGIDAMLPLSPCSRSSLLVLPAGVRSFLRPQILTLSRRYLADGKQLFLFHPLTISPRAFYIVALWDLVSIVRCRTSLP
jgi:hypothetical protein